jgi:hypothetical protein
MGDGGWRDGEMGHKMKRKRGKQRWRESERHTRLLFYSLTRRASLTLSVSHPHTSFSLCLFHDLRHKYTQICIHLLPPSPSLFLSLSCSLSPSRPLFLYTPPHSPTTSTTGNSAHSCPLSAIYLQQNVVWPWSLAPPTVNGSQVWRMQRHIQQPPSSPMHVGRLLLPGTTHRRNRAPFCRQA